MKISQLKAIKQAILLLCPLLTVSPAMAQIAPVGVELARQASQPAAVQARVAAASEHLNAMRGELGLTGNDQLTPVSTVVDEFAHSHTRFQQRYQGVKIWGGEVITHADAGGQQLALTNALKTEISVSTTPRLSTDEALAVVRKTLLPKGKFSTEPVFELVIYPQTEPVLPRGVANEELDATMVGERVLGHLLTYHVHVELNNKNDGVKHVDFLIDANTGAIVKQWNSLQTAHTVATGARGYYNGTVSLNTNSTASGYELRDMLRGTGGSFGNNVVLKYNTATPVIGDIFTDPTNTWGDGQNYTPGSSTTSDSYQTPAVDVAYGIGATWDFYKNIFGRNGIDGAGKATYAVVHDPLPQYNGVNAYWSDTCFCMHYGDGNATYKNVTSLDVTGHELTHGVTAKTAGLYYVGESGGLNEATSDIFGSLVEFYKRGGGTSTIPATGGNWTIGEGIGPSPFRYMYKPSLDGGSFDAWNLTIADADVHYSSGPMNRAFYFLSQGATTSGNTSSTYLPAGMTGIGNDRAGRIWYRALTVYLTNTTNYVSAREGSIAAARDLYGNGSAEEKAVWNAFRAVNVGAAWSAAACGVLDAGRNLSKDEGVTSCNGQYSLVMQADGNLVLYRNSNGTPLWNANTYNNPNAFALLQADGNLVVYKNSSRVALWNAGTYSSPGATTAVRDDGNVVITSPNGLPVWYSTPPAATPLQQTGAGNTSIATSEVLATGKTGFIGNADPATNRYYQVTLSPGQTVTGDLIGAWLSSEYAYWGLFVVNNAGTDVVPVKYSSHSNTRIVQSYKNTGTTPTTVYFRTYRGGTAYELAPFTIAFRFN
jgi:Zn-dependent metalloprotease